MASCPVLARSLPWKGSLEPENRLYIYALHMSYHKDHYPQVSADHLVVLKARAIALGQ